MDELVVHPGKLRILELEALECHTASDGWGEPLADAHLEGGCHTVEHVTASEG